MSVALFEKRYGELNPVIVSDLIEDPDHLKVLILGGMQQNYERLCDVIKALENYGIASIGWSAFDTVDPKLEPSEDDNEMTREIATKLELPEWYPPRMVMRAQRLLYEIRNVVDYFDVEFSAVMTHCAALSVFALASEISNSEPEMKLDLPSRLIAVEPMIVEFDSALKYAKGDYLKHEKAARKDTTLIRLSELTHPNSESSPIDNKSPLEDIGRGCGRLLLSRMAKAYDLHVVTSQGDYAAPHDDIVEIVGEDAVSSYPDQYRFGHGYLLAEPIDAVNHIAELVKG